MSKWEITFVHTDDFSMQNPLEETSRFTRLLEAPTAAEAILNLHQERGMVFVQDIKGVLPIVWEIKKHD